MTMSVNGKEISPADTMLNLKGYSELFNKDVPNQIYDFKFKDNGSEVDLKLKMKIYYIRNKSKDESTTIGRSPRNQGFYVLRNNRQITRASSLDLFTRHPSLNGFRAELFFSSEYDEYFNVSLQKKDIEMPQGLSDKIKSLIDPILKSIKANDSLEDRRKEESINDEDLKNTIDKIKKNINDKGSKIRPEGVMSTEDKRKNVEKSKKEKEEKTTEPKGDRPYPKNTIKKSLNIFDYGFESQREKGDICRYVNQGNGVIAVKVNIDHIFYQEVFLPSNDDVKNNLMSLLFSFGRAQEEILRDMEDVAKIDTRELFDDKLERISRIFSKIIKD